MSLDAPASDRFGLLAEVARRYFIENETQDTIATCEYGGPVTAAAQRENVVATQFHPEKSGVMGLHLLRNFVELVAAGAVTRSAIATGDR